MSNRLAAKRALDSLRAKPLEGQIHELTALAEAYKPTNHRLYLGLSNAGQTIALMKILLDEFEKDCARILPKVHN